MAFHPAVLIVDDEPVSAEIYARALRNKGFATVVSDSAEEGLVMAKQYAPRIVISDVQMPGTDGIAFCNAMTNQELRTGPFLFHTGYDDLSVIRQGLAAGGDDFLAKGMPLDKFLQRVFFWTATSFRKLPDAARERALTLANELTGEVKAPIRAASKIDVKLLKQLADVVVEEVAQVSDTFGTRMVERIYFLGRLSHLVLQECSDFSTAIRFPDYLAGAIAYVEFPWIEDLSVLFAYYDHYARDPRFQEAAREGLKEVPN